VCLSLSSKGNILDSPCGPEKAGVVTNITVAIAATTTKYLTFIWILLSYKSLANVSFNIYQQSGKDF
jgi:hypothetical protein